MLKSQIQKTIVTVNSFQTPFIAFIILFKISKYIKLIYATNTVTKLIKPPVFR